jgi:hypothetical protein
MPKHRLRGETHLAEEALGSAPGKIEHSLGLGGGDDRVADDGDVVLVLDVEQGARCLLGQAARHLLVDEVDDLFLDGCRPQRGRRRTGLLARQALEQIVRQALCLEAHADHGTPHELDGFRVGRVQEEHGRRVAGTKALLPHLAQQVAHVHGHIAEIDLHRAG